MQPANKNIRPTDRKLDTRVIILGALGFLALATVFFFLGLFCIGPMMRNHFQPSQEVASSPSHTPRTSVGDEASRDTETPYDSNLDIEITEEGEETPSAADEGTATGDQAVRQDDEGLTITLEPEQPETATASTRSEESTRQTGDRSASSSVRPRSGMEKPRASVEIRHEKPTETAETSSRLFRVQAGTFANRANADALATELREKGYKTEIHSVQVEDRTLYRVQLGGYRTREDAQELANDLSAEGYSPTIIAD